VTSRPRLAASFDELIWTPILLITTPTFSKNVTYAAVAVYFFVGAATPALGQDKPVVAVPDKPVASVPDKPIAATPELNTILMESTFSHTRSKKRQR
jgi:hypothetical protein